MSLDVDNLCSAFARLAASCEGGTMMENLTTGAPENNNRTLGSARVAGAGRGRGMMARQPTPWNSVTTLGSSNPYQRMNPNSTSNTATSFSAALNSISSANTPVPESCGCEPATRENIYLGMMHTARERNRWDDEPLDAVRKRVADMARLGTEDNQMCVPWRVAPRNTTHLPVTTVEGELYEADFVIVAPSPQKYYEGETMVFTPKVAVQPNACLLSVLTTLECKFKACWEMAHLVSLTGRDKEERLPYSATLLACLARSRNVPDETPWAIIRPFAQPPNTVAPPVSVSILNIQPVSNESAAQATVEESLKEVFRSNDTSEDTAVDMGNGLSS